jgi:hypothetical protein
VDQNLEGKYKNLLGLKNIPNYSSIEGLIYPITPKIKSIFIDSEAITLAELDSFFSISGNVGSYLAHQTLGRFTYISIDSHKGSVIQYLQYRRPQSYGYSYSKFKLEERYLDMTRLSIENPMKTSREKFSSDILIYESDGVDLVIAEGTDVNKNALLISQTLKIGGTGILQIEDVNTFTSDVIYLLSNIFDKVWLYKPFTTNSCKIIYYFIGKGFRGRQGYYKSIINLLKSPTSGIVYPETFQEWLTKNNNNIMNNVIDNLDKIKKISNNEIVSIPRYNLYRLLVVLDLPDNTDEPIQPDWRGSTNYFDDITSSRNPA